MERKTQFAISVTAVAAGLALASYLVFDALDHRRLTDDTWNRLWWIAGLSYGVGAGVLNRHPLIGAMVGAVFGMLSQAILLGVLLFQMIHFD